MTANTIPVQNGSLERIIEKVDTRNAAAQILDFSS